MKLSLPNPPAVNGLSGMRNMFNRRLPAGAGEMIPLRLPSGLKAPRRKAILPVNPPQAQPDRRGAAQSGPPDLDELWRDFSRKLGGLFGGGPAPGAATAAVQAVKFQPDMKSAGIGGLIRGFWALDLVGHWLLHCARRPAGGDHPVRQVQIHRRGRFQLALALPH